jgi:hypothetical protein
LAHRHVGREEILAGVGMAGVPIGSRSTSVARKWGKPQSTEDIAPYGHPELSDKIWRYDNYGVEFYISRYGVVEMEIAQEPRLLLPSGARVGMNAAQFRAREPLTACEDQGNGVSVCLLARTPSGGALTQVKFSTGAASSVLVGDLRSQNVPNEPGLG